MAQSPKDGAPVMPALAERFATAAAYRQQRANNKKAYD
jgi:hypothetical protein